MPAYHVILHTYGSWLPDRPEGYYNRKNDGRHSTDEIRSGAYQNVMREKAVELTSAQQSFLLQSAKAIVKDRQWGLHAIAVTSTHVHVVLSWNTKLDVTEIYSLLKQSLTWQIKKQQAYFGEKLFSRGAGIVKIRDWDHLVELVKHYIPSHGKYVEVEERIRLRL